MIFNRTYNDIVRAKRILAEKVRKFIALSDDESAVIDKAFFNLKAVNRITSKLAEIWEKIADTGTPQIDSDDVREWDRKEIFKEKNFDGVISNIKDAIDALDGLGVDVSALQISLANVNLTYSYINLNNIEKLLYDVGTATAELLELFAYQIDEILYIVGAYEVSQEGSVLIIE